MRIPFTEQVLDYPKTSPPAQPTFSAETWFIPVSLLFGILFLLTTPPFQVADESRHFVRAYQLSERTLALLELIHPQELLPESVVNAIEQTNYLQSQSGPKVTFDQLIGLSSISLEPTKRANFNEYASYSFVSYLPQIAVIIPLRLLEVNAVITLYVARLAALLFWIALTCQALRLIPIAKPLFLFIVLLPMTLFQAGSLSADSVTFAVSFLLVAVFLRMAYGPGRVQRRYVLLTAGLGATLTAVKFVYAPLIGLYFLIPRTKFGSSTAHMGGFALMGCLCLLVLCAPFNSLFIQATAGRQESAAAFDSLTPHPQLNFLLDNTLPTAVATFQRFGRSYMNGFVGILGWYGATLPSYLYVVTVITLWATALTTGKESFVVLKHKLLLLVVIIVITMAICAGVCTDPRENPVPTLEMKGIQGRYFTPFALLIGLLVSNRRPGLQRYQRHIKKLLLPFILFLLTSAYYCLLARYYL